MNRNIKTASIAHFEALIVFVITIIVINAA